MFNYVFEYRHKMTGETFQIDAEGDNSKEAEHKAYKQVFAVVDEDGLTCIDHDEAKPRYEKSEGEKREDAFYAQREQAINDGEW